MTHTFGGEWTEEKLAVMHRYFSAYAQALKNQPFSRWYIDAFAGSGERTTVKTSEHREDTLFDDEISDFIEVKEGSVRIALGINPPFDKYVFVEQSVEYVAALEALRSARYTASSPDPQASEALPEDRETKQCNAQTDEQESSLGWTVAESTFL